MTALKQTYISFLAALMMMMASIGLPSSSLVCATATVVTIVHTAEAGTKTATYSKNIGTSKIGVQVYAQGRTVNAANLAQLRGEAWAKPHAFGKTVTAGQALVDLKATSTSKAGTIKLVLAGKIIRNQALTDDLQVGWNYSGDMFTPPPRITFHVAVVTVTLEGQVTGGLIMGGGVVLSKMPQPKVSIGAGIQVYANGTVSVLAGWSWANLGLEATLQFINQRLDANYQVTNASWGGTLAYTRLPIRLKVKVTAHVWHWSWSLGTLIDETWGAIDSQAVPFL